MAECSVDGCSDPVRARGVCVKHYDRQFRKPRRAPDPNPLPPDYYDRQFGEPPTRGGLFAAQVGRDDRRHRCGRCMNPYSGGREDCVNNKEVRHA